MNIAWLKRLPCGSVRENAPLAKRTWLKVGGAAQVLFIPEDAKDLALVLRQYPVDAPLFCLGVGSNTLIRDGGITALVVQLGGGFAEIHQLDGHRLQTGARGRSVQVAKKAAEWGLGGLSFLAGIPGSIGGALAMNAGAYGGEIFDQLESIQWMDRGGVIHHLPKSELEHGYRHCGLKEGIFISAVFCCPCRVPAELQAEIAAVQQRRAETQPVGVATGGSTFVNPMQDSPITGDRRHAWQWIDAAGCRGMRVGGAEISEKHCNFMINAGGASAADFEILAETVRERVRAQFGIELQWEIRREGIPARHEAESV
ncbi:MAG: UDP-N-acetylmuramate dehydrogenase [Alphaproteobacteria bacterium]|nr:UDP-N-acetylmuramate dehydrogenase [Alphaproteobacteria bacterium]